MDSTEALKNLLKALNGVTVRPEELARVARALTKLLKDTEKRLSADADGKEAKLTSQMSTLASRLSSQITALEDTIDQKDSIYKGNISALAEELRSLVASVEKKIPTVPPPQDLSPLEEAIRDVEAKIPVFIQQSPQEIRNALELLQDDERLDVSAIKGLTEKLEKIEKSSKSGGTSHLSVGHWPLHEVFTMDGIATSVTLQQAPGAQGTAIFGIRYQGQVLNLGTQYTVDGNKITFVGFTPEADTTISASYMP